MEKGSAPSSAQPPPQHHHQGATNPGQAPPPLYAHGAAPAMAVPVHETHHAHHVALPADVVMAMALMEHEPYSTQLFDCGEDVETCLLGAFCLPCQVGQWAEHSMSGDCCASGSVYFLMLQLNHFVPFLGSLVAASYLSGLVNNAAEAYGITHRTDLCTAFLCAPCVSCRMAREVKHRRATGQLPMPRGPAMFMTAPPPVAMMHPHAGPQRGAPQAYYAQVPQHNPHHMPPPPPQAEPAVTYTAHVAHPQNQGKF